MMELKDAKIFPCKKLGVNNDGIIVEICYEVIYIENDNIIVKGIPSPVVFDNGYSVNDLADPITVLHSGTIQDILLNSKCDISDLYNLRPRKLLSL